MTGTADRMPWTVVHLTADDSPATRNVSMLLRWLAEQPDISLHTVLWLPGWADTDAFRLGRFHDVARDHRAWLARSARRAGLDDKADALTRRAVRSTLATVPATGAIYLNGAGCVVALRYIPPGERTVVTHLHPTDRDADPPLLPERVEHLLAATDVWLAADEETRDWAVAEWGIDPDAVGIVGDLVDLAGWDGRNHPEDPNRLSLAIAGGAWFRSDHTARLVQALLRLRPALDLDLLWTEVEQEEHLAPLLHDLGTLGVRDRLRLPASHGETAERLRDAHVLALTAPDDDPPWEAWQAAQRGLPVVCFDSHRRAPDIGRHVEGRVVGYLDVVEMAGAVLDLVDATRTGAARDFEASRAALADRDIRVVGRQLIERTREVGR